MKVQRLDHITITSMDPAASVRFYQEILGFVPVYEWTGDVTMLEAGGTFIAIAHWAVGSAPSAQPAITVDHFALTSSSSPATSFTARTRRCRASSETIPAE
jgi:catechol 2,3-dioxygenase-like lactoylglutathione lyase family enzyme